MSLLDELREYCTMIDKRTVTDPRGGLVQRWVDGARFEAAVTVDDSVQTHIAQAQGVKSVYTVVTQKGINLQYHDVFRRDSDGKVFRVTSDGDDNKTPPSSALNMRAVTAEEWTLPVDANG